MLKVKKTHMVPAFREFRLEVELGECKAGQRGAASLLKASAIISCEIQRPSRGTGQQRERVQQGWTRILGEKRTRVQEREHA